MMKVRLKVVAVANAPKVNPFEESEELVPSLGLKIAGILSGSSSPAKLNDEDAEITVRIGSRGPDCSTSGDRAACRHRAERSGTDVFVELRACASPGARLCELSLQANGLALVQLCCASLLVDGETRARRQGKAGFFRMENVYSIAKARQIGFHLWTHLDRQDAAAYIHCNASRGKTHRRE